MFEEESMITITWHLLVLILAELFGFAWAITRDAKNRGVAGTARSAAILLWSIASVVTVMIYGGFVWW